jgi:hypothetical protein
MRQFDLVISGAKKSGTSSLSYYVGQHPYIRGHKSREISYFVSDREYKREFSSVFQEYYPDGVDQEQLVLAKSVDVAYVEKAAQRLKEHSPDCKIVMVLRDPVDRAYSAYWHMRREGWETKETFEKALDAEEEHKEEDIALHCSYRERGCYYSQIKRLRNLFGAKNVQVLLYRDLKKAPVATCQSVFKFGGVDPTFEPSTGVKLNTAKKARSEWISQQVVNWFFRREDRLRNILAGIIPTPLARRVRETIQNWNRTDFTRPPMNENTRQALAEHFEPHNQKLESLIGKSLDHWTRA